MPRESPFDIELTVDEHDILEETARAYTSPYIDVVRAKIILYAAEGLTNKEIGERLDTPRQIVSKWRKRFFDQRLAGLQEQPRRGRPGQFSPLRRRRRKGSTARRHTISTTGDSTSKARRSIKWAVSTTRRLGIIWETTVRAYKRWEARLRSM